MKSTSLLIAALSVSLLSGCSQIAQISEPMNFKTGTEITQQQMNSFKVGKTKQDDIVAAIGHPPAKSQLGSKEIWTYTYTMIPMVPFTGVKNTFENSVFEFNSRGVLLKAYKTGGTPGQSGNPLLNAAGM